MKKWLVFAVCLTLILGLAAGCRKGNGELLNFEKPKTGEPTVTIETTMGNIQVVLFPQAAPKAVENFTAHAENGYYNNVIFHRVIEGFMIQSGDPTGTGRGGESIWKKVFKNEVSAQARNFRGALAMANAGADTNGSQFYIVQAGPDQISDSVLSQAKAQSSLKFTQDVIDKYKQVGGAPWLDGGYTVFGQVIAGMDVVDKIAEVAVDTGDKPLTPVSITGTTVAKVQ